MLCTVLAVPIMLFPKPFIRLLQNNMKKSKAAKAAAGDEVEADKEMLSADGHGDDHDGHGGEFEFGEVFIHQIIETIEYVLGTVSHTASYLRICARHSHVSSRHLSSPEDTHEGFGGGSPLNGIFLYIMFGAWLMVTLRVLLGMNVLECFLHTLRLHWVEFQSKVSRPKGSPPSRTASQSWCAHGSSWTVS